MIENMTLHTPEGVRDIYGDDMDQKVNLEDLLYRKIKSFGYQSIQTPSFEYYDVFSRDKGFTPSTELFKFFDSKNNTLALRPDFTPGVARAAARYFSDVRIPLRFSYLGNTYSNRSNLQGKLKETTELGIEYMGDGSVEADAEIIALSAELLDTAGLKDYMICVGNAGYFNAISDYAELDEDAKNGLAWNIRNKNYSGIEEVLRDIETDKKMDKEVEELFLSFTDSFGGTEVLEEAAARVGGIENGIREIERLTRLYELCGSYNIQDRITFDLGLLGKHNYYTGMVFRAYAFGSGEALVRGGRYDNLLSRFGSSGAAIGFTVVIDQLMNTLKSMNISHNERNDGVLLLYDISSAMAAVSVAEEVRAAGMKAELMPLSESVTKEEYLEHARKTHEGKVVVFRNGEAGEL